MGRLQHERRDQDLVDRAMVEHPETVVELQRRQEENKGRHDKTMY